MKRLFFILAAMFPGLVTYGQDPGDLFLPFSDDGYYIENWTDTITTAKTIAVTPEGNLLVPGIIRQSSNNSFLMMMDKIGATIHGNVSRGFCMNFTASPDEAAMAAETAPDGKILVAGYYMYHMYHPWVVRLLANGQLDESFGEGGVWDGSGINIDVQDMAIYTSGDSYRIILCGTSTTGNYPNLVMISDNGSLATEFGTDGIISLSASRGTFKSLSVDNENNVLYASGFVTEGAGTIIARYNLPDGTPDTGFGTDGALVYPPLVFPGAALAQVLDKSDNTLTLFGSYKHAVGDNDLFAYRLNALTGDADVTFGQSGWALLRIPESDEEITGAELQADGKYCFAGDYSKDGNTNMFTGRILHDGTGDVAFGTNGLLIVPAAGGQFVSGLKLSPRQNIMYVTGTHVDEVSSSIFVVAYYTGYETEPPVYTPLSVTNTLDGGPGSLRQALINANLNPGPDTVLFNIAPDDPGYNDEKGVWTIMPLTALPFLEDDSTVVDGTSQTLLNGNTNSSGPEIEISGQNLIDGCLKINGEGSIIRSLIINGFTAYALDIVNQNTIITGSYFGTNSAGTLAIPNGTGIKISNHSNHTIIGGLTPDERNIISGNATYGVLLIDDADSNMIIGNFIGTDFSGTEPLGNLRAGIAISNGSSCNIIGGNTPAKRNIISGNIAGDPEDNAYGNGIYIEKSDSNVITGNFIGTDKDGTFAIPNTNSGIYVFRCGRNIIGGNAAGEGNVISGNGSSGIYLNYTYCSSNVISGNFIGTDIAGVNPIPNADYGIRMQYGSVSNIIGPYNCIRNNGLSGILCSGANSMSNTFTRNSISNNEGDGISFDAGANHDIPAPVITEATPERIKGTAGTGYVIELFSDADTEGAIYEGTVTADPDGNFEWTGHASGPFVTAIATDADGNSSEFSEPLPSLPEEPASLTVTNTLDSGDGSLRNALEKAESNPGTDTVKFNIPSDDPGYDESQKVWVIQPLTEFTQLFNGNTVVDGTTQTLNVGDYNPTGPEIMISGINVLGSGFILLSDNNVIKGLIINGFQNNAVQIMGDGNRIVGNYVGCNATGTESMPNQNGIEVVYGSKHTIIGGGLMEDRNVISGNRNCGILIAAPGTDSTVIKGNFIGTDYTGEDTLCNGYCGIHIVNDAAYTIIGGPDEGDRNIITGIRNYANLFTGNAITIEQSNFNSIKGNYIGTNHEGTAVLYNGPRGILVAHSAGNQIGGSAPGEGNVISGHTWSGIFIRFSESRDNIIEGNFIGTGPEGSDSLGNAIAGIQLDYGAQNNRIGPANVIKYNGSYGIFSMHDSTLHNTITGNSISNHSEPGIYNEVGANDSIPSPEVSEVTLTGVTGTACPNCIVEIFSDEEDEGDQFEGMTTADLSGNFSWPGLVRGPFVTATATDPGGNTSGFSEPFEVSSAVAVNDLQSSVPSLQNAPNPFTDFTLIRYTVPEGQITLTVCDVSGRRLARLAEGFKPAGDYEIIWDGTDTGGNQVISGVYYCVLQTGMRVFVRKIIRL